MKTVNIKTKTMIIIVIILAVLLGAIYFFTPKLMAAAIRGCQDRDRQEAAMILKDRLIRYFPWSEEARDEAFTIGEHIFSGDKRFYITPFFSGGASDLNFPVSAEKAIAYLERVSRAQGENLWKYNGFYLIGNLYAGLGDYVQAENWFNLALGGYEKLGPNYEWKTAEVTGSLIEMYLESKDYNSALALIETGIKRYTQSSELAKLYAWQADAYYDQDNYVEAKAAYTKALELEGINWQDMMERQKEMAGQDNMPANINAALEQQPGYRHARARLDIIASLEGSGKEKGGIDGVIRAGASPLANVQVTLINEKEYDGRSNYLEGISAQPPVVTGADGRFSFRSVTPGRYFVVLGFIPEDLKGLGRFKGLEVFTVKAGETVELDYCLRPQVRIVEPAGRTSFREGEEMTIAWEAVPEAASYNINLSYKTENGYVSRVYREGLTDTAYVFAPRGLELREMNFVTFNETMQVGPSAILGSFYPGAQIFFQVEAFDKDGRSISDSEGYVMQLSGNYPWVEITGTENFSEGDQLLLAKKYGEALSAYQNEAAADPGNIYAILSLARLYHHGWTEGTENLEQALNYYQRLLDLTDETFILEEAASAAAMARDYQMALQLFTRIEERLDPQSFWFHRMGELYFLTGQPEKAIAYYLKYLDGKREFADLGPVVAMLYTGDLPEALDLLRSKEYPEKPRHTGSGQTERSADIRRITANLQRYAGGAPSTLSRAEFKAYLDQIMRISGRNRSDQVKAFQDEVRTEGENDLLVQVLLELARDRY